MAYDRRAKMTAIGLMIQDVLILLAVLAAGYLWWQQDAFRRRALALARQGAARAGAQLLDDSVGLSRWRWRRETSGWGLERVYAFEVSATGGERFTGRVVFFGLRVMAVDIDFTQPLVV